MRAALAILLATLGCASQKPCPPAPIVPRPPEEPPPPPILETAKAGTRTAATAKLSPAPVARSATFLGCDIHYYRAPPGSEIFLRWFVFEDAEGYEAEDPINATNGKTQAVKGNGLIEAFLKSAEGPFHSGIYVCDFVLMRDGKELVPHQRGAIWVDPPKAKAAPPP